MFWPSFNGDTANLMKIVTFLANKLYITTIWFVISYILQYKTCFSPKHLNIIYINLLLSETTHIEAKIFLFGSMTTSL